jgi:hypothetical protein
MTEDKFLERLRGDAAQLRYTPQDAFVWTRLAAQIRAALAQNDTTVAAMLARWLRPIAASFVMLALVASLSVTWVERRESSNANDLVASNSVEITVDGDTYSLGQ